MGRLSFEIDEQLEENTATLLRSAVTQFLDKYQSYIGFSDEERTEVLAQCDPNGSLEDAMYLALTTDHSSDFTYVCVDNYTAPYEKARAEDWPQITAILNKALFGPLMALVVAEYIDSGLLVGSSEMDDDLMVSLASKEQEVDEWSDDIYGDFPPKPIPFTGLLPPSATDLTHDPRMQAAIGVTQGGVMALGRAVLGDEVQAVAFSERMAKIPSRTFSDSPNTERVWATGDVSEMLRDMVEMLEVTDKLREDNAGGLVPW